ncbi:plasmid mobilization protein [Heyndrickxia sporothermodurans]|uniref:plasmid mobilization protein n=1 Tax=Heyndrickxia sporothermodurans TaxID=46224 RepID=UPI0013FD5346|nr:ribbon-helix-helix protein, CopG family [Heyndrickxia sporothermodurans]
MKKDQIVPVRLSENEKDFLKEDADKMGIGVSTLIRMVLRDYIKERSERSKDK